jgi:hypothetical protein
LRDAIDIEVTHASQAAIHLIESRGGKVTCFDYDRKTLRSLLKPERFLGPPTPSLPTDRNIRRMYCQFNIIIPLLTCVLFPTAFLARYFDPAARGYLAGQVETLMKLTKPQ